MAADPPQSIPLFAFDVGNTSVKCAAFARAEWEQVLRVETRPVQALAERLRAALPAARAASFSGGRCVVSSVCPAADRAIASFWAGIGGVGRAEFFGGDLPVPMPTRALDPGKVGVDRLLLALGAREVCGSPCIVVSAGTAITADLVDEDGAFAGGAIAPGLGLAAVALHDAAALLPLVEPARPQDPVGTDTEAAVRSGVYWSCAGGVLALIARYRERPGCAAAPVVYTGTDASLLLCAMPREQRRHEPFLLFKGIEAAL